MGTLPAGHTRALRLLTAKKGPDFDISVRNGSITIGVATDERPRSDALPLGRFGCGRGGA